MSAARLTVLLIGFALCASPASSAATTPSWLEVVRQTPYSHTKGLYDNLAAIRRWVLMSTGYCDTPDRHLLFNTRGRYLGWMSNADSSADTQEKLNALRQRLYDTERVSTWVAGGADSTGYPFALSCNQPHVDIEQAIARVLGEEDKLWGTWDGMRIGSPEAPVPLAEVVNYVFDHKTRQLNFEASRAVKEVFFGQIIIESGARKFSASNAKALGLLQLRPEVLKNCDLAPEFHLHRMAQIDCAVRLYIINDRNLRPAFDQRFEHLSEDKRERLYALLLVQTFHGGIGRMLSLLGEDTEGKASRFYAEHESMFSAEDIALGMIFHNMGRNQFGLASLYYLVDVHLAAEALCHNSPVLCAPAIQ